MGGRSPILLMLLATLMCVSLGAGLRSSVQDQPEGRRHGVERVRDGLAETSAGMQEIADDISAELRRRWLEDGKVHVVVVEAQGEVDNFLRDSIQSRINTARNLGAEVVILKLDTYGRLVTAGLEAR